MGVMMDILENSATYVCFFFLFYFKTHFFNIQIIKIVLTGFLCAQLVQMDIMAKTVQVFVHQIVRRVAILTGSVTVLPAGTDSTVIPVILFSNEDISKFYISK